MQRPSSQEKDSLEDNLAVWRIEKRGAEVDEQSYAPFDAIMRLREICLLPMPPKFLENSLLSLNDSA